MAENKINVEETLRKVHADIAVKFKEMLEDPERTISYQELNAMIKFLKDNDIYVKPEGNDNMEKLAELIASANIDDDEEFVPERRLNIVRKEANNG